MNKYISSLLVVSGLLLSSMTGSVHKSTGGVAAAQETITPFTTEKQIAIQVKTLTPDESKLFLGHDLISRGTIPIQFDIENNTGNEYSLCASSIDLPHLNPKKVAFSVSKSAIPRMIGWRILSFFFWPLMLPATIDGIRTYSHYKFLCKDLNAKSLKEKGETVLPYSTYHRILFVPKEGVKEEFAVTLIDLETFEPQEVKAQLQAGATTTG